MYEEVWDRKQDQKNFKIKKMRRIKTLDYFDIVDW